MSGLTYCLWAGLPRVGLGDHSVGLVDVLGAGEQVQSYRWEQVVPGRSNLVSLSDADWGALIRQGGFTWPGHKPVGGAEKQTWWNPGDMLH